MVANLKDADALMRRWSASQPEHIQLYAVLSPNGVKVMAMLAECELAHDYHRIEFGIAGTRSPDFLAANPDGRIPLLLDPFGPGESPILLAESNVILRYLAEKTGRFWPDDPAKRWQIEQWLLWQAASLGATCGQIGYFHRFEGREIDDPRPLARQVAEVRRLLKQLDDHMAQRDWLVGADCTIADIAVLPLIRNLIGYYSAGELIGIGDFVNVKDWLDRWLARPHIEATLST